MTFQKVYGVLGEVNIPHLRALLLHFAFEERIRGSHHIFRRNGIEERINLQKQGSKAKPYQVRQVRAIILRYRLGEISDV